MPAAGSNGFDRDELAQYLAEVDRADDELAGLTSKHLEACKAPRGWLRDTMAAAKATVSAAPRP